MTTDIYSDEYKDIMQQYNHPTSSATGVANTSLVQQESEQQKKARVTQSVIELLGQLEQTAQISVVRAVAEFYEIAQELGR